MDFFCINRSTPQLSTLRLEENNWKDSMEEASKMEIEPLLAFLKQVTLSI